MKKLIWFAVWAFALVGIFIFKYHSDYLVAGLPSHNDIQHSVVTISSDKDPDSLPDPNRPYYDACGNKYDYMGNLISKGSGCQLLQPIEGK